ncbi:hypothetical protein M404DRAFT_991778 [Pisolithus tinctorius Marx 270]|uniref:Uncharacterized protein n=1 Tax=Pisolithus tinctorius Marx 270 TaxID=870435 RepID=A0A0C3KZX2_PISTI|nr:hypothetical protein M404DRAFT_991778 [Pisolithus tinctorius Marx 270]
MHWSLGFYVQLSSCADGPYKNAILLDRSRYSSLISIHLCPSKHIRQNFRPTHRRTRDWPWNGRYPPNHEIL